nr:hypothetical protein [Tanacetum cinerariifolium]
GSGSTVVADGDPTLPVKFLSCKASRATHRAVLSFLVTNAGEPVQLQIQALTTADEPSLVVDEQGRAYSASSDYYPRLGIHPLQATLPPNLPLSCSLTLLEVPTGVTRFNQAVLSFMRLYVLSEAQWSVLAPLLPGRRGPAGQHNRRFVEAVLWLARPRRRLRHAAAGFHYGASPPARSRGAKKNRADPALGRSRGGLSTKLHLLTDVLGRPVRALLTAGSVHDRTPAEQLLADLRPAYLVADRGYDARTWRTYLAARGTLAMIPAQRKRGDTAYTPARYGHDAPRYRQRNPIERTFAQLKQFRRFATRYDKRADCFLACEYALAGYEHHVVDYLLKPSTLERFLIATQKAQRRFKADQPVLTLQSLRSLETHLPAEQFARIHKSYVVAFARIAFIERNRQALSSGMASVRRRWLVPIAAGVPNRQGMCLA